MGYVTRPERRFRGLLGAALMILIGLLHLSTGIDESVRQAGAPIPAMQWT